MKRWQLLYFLVCLFLFLPQLVQAQIQTPLKTSASRSDPVSTYLPDQLLVKFKTQVEIQNQTEVVGLTNVTNINKRLGINSMNPLGTSGVFKQLVRVDLTPGTDLDTAISSYKNDPNVEFAEPNYLRFATWIPNDPYFTANPLNYFQWNLARINMPQAWDLVSGGTSSIKVAVVDSGVAFETYNNGTYNYVKAPELSTVNFVTPFYVSSISCPGACSACTVRPQVIRNSHPNDDAGHGTHVTATIAQMTNNGSQGTGIAFNSSVIPIKVMEACTDDQGFPTSAGSTSDIIEGINYAVTNGAKVINLSLGDVTYSATERSAIQAAVAAGSVVVAATGNSATRTSSPPISYPAGYPETIAVGASRWDNKRAEYSSYTPVTYPVTRGVDLVAPGGQTFKDADDPTIQTNPILDQNNDFLGDGIVQQTIFFKNRNQFTSVGSQNFGYYCVDTLGYINYENCGNYQGTSMAAPHVTAAAALLLAKNPSLTPAQVKTSLTTTANKTVIPSYNTNEYGQGLLDVYAALNQVTISPSPSPTPTPSPSPTPTPPPVPGDTNGDREVNFTDLTTWIDHYRLFATVDNITSGNFNGDTKINALDFGVMAKNYQH